MAREMRRVLLQHLTVPWTLPFAFPDRWENFSKHTSVTRFPDKESLRVTITSASLSASSTNPPFQIAGMRTCAHTCTSTHMHTYARTHTRTQTHAQGRTCAHTVTHPQMHIYKRMRTHTPLRQPRSSPAPILGGRSAPLRSLVAATWVQPCRGWDDWPYCFIYDAISCYKKVNSNCYSVA